MEIYKPGTKITVGENITATILQAIITQTNNCLYKCVWWSGRTRHEEFLYDCEFTSNTTKKKIGFK